MNRLVGERDQSFASLDQPEFETEVAKTNRVTPQSMLASFFSRSKVCKLPRKLARKLRRSAKSSTSAESPAATVKRKRRKSDQDPFLPSEVGQAIADVRDTDGNVLAGTSLANAIHRATVGDSLVIFESSPTATSLDIAALTVKGRNNVFYSLDCSGYLSASLKAVGGTAAVRVDASVAGDIASSASMLTVRAQVAAPLGLALRPENYLGMPGFTPEQRMGLLLTLASATAEAKEDDKISVPKYFYIVGTATQSGQSMQGKVDISGRGSGGVGVAQIDASAGAGFSIAKRVSYAVFDTILLPAPAGEEATITTTVAEVRRAARRMIARARNGISLDTVNNARVLRPRLPESVCDLDWRLTTSDADADADGLGEAEPRFENGECVFTLRLSKAGGDSLTAGTLVLELERLGYGMRVADPL